MEIREERQQSVADEVSTLIAVRPIIDGVLRSIRTEMISGVGMTREDLPLMTLGRLRKEGHGDTGIALADAVHVGELGTGAHDTAVEGPRPVRLHLVQMEG